MRGPTSGPTLSKTINVQENTFLGFSTRQHGHRPNTDHVVDVMTQVEDVIVRQDKRGPGLVDITGPRAMNVAVRIILDGYSRIHRERRKASLSFPEQGEEARVKGTALTDFPHFAEIHLHVPHLMRTTDTDTDTSSLHRKQKGLSRATYLTVGGGFVVDDATDVAAVH